MQPGSSNAISPSSLSLRGVQLSLAHMVFSQPTPVPMALPGSSISHVNTSTTPVSSLDPTQAPAILSTLMPVALSIGLAHSRLSTVPTPMPVPSSDDVQFEAVHTGVTALAVTLSPGSLAISSRVASSSSYTPVSCPAPPSQAPPRPRAVNRRTGSRPHADASNVATTAAPAEDDSEKEVPLAARCGTYRTAGCS